MAAGIPSLPPPVFVNDADGLDPNKILADMIAEFEAASGRILQPAQVERLLINLYAYRESLVRNAIQFAGEQNLLAFAIFPMIDYLGQLLGVTRLAAQPALTTLQFTLTGPLTVPFIITKGTLIGTADGHFTFATTASLAIAPGAITGLVGAAATVPGEAANGYLAEQVRVQINPSALIASVGNVTPTADGSAPETDEHLRMRIQQAPNQFSTAGPVAAYRFFAMGADPSIVDAQIVSPVPGTVNVYVLTGPVTIQPAPAPNLAGIASSELLAKVQAAVNAETVRPLTDTVNALAVVEVDYQMVATVTMYADADPTQTIAAASAAAQQFAIDLASKIQRDIVPSQIVAALSVPGVYEVTVDAPHYTQLSAGQWANCTAITLTQAFSPEHS
ncbi:MAG: baseplate J/gp47 family protein [Candidatus Binatus sp.]|uniref:baseplate assembly protein n=1 Tax=Candidatus Binatus sp. TaxID=2811406 RepID=UPI00271660BC|nr:baseplate J/gp47 family protein [Candidatus Binatus sp.]MDO8433504.1 baseplate J/gp47 family protein [Candidatus Binatus sp.]